MKNTGKSMLVLVTLGTVFFGFNGVNAQAKKVTWHKGIPSTFKTHKYWVTKSKGKTEYGKNYYGRKFISFSYNTGIKAYDFDEVNAMYYKNGKGYITDDFINYDASGVFTPYLSYAKTSKNTYEFKRTKQMSGWPEEHIRFQKSGSSYKVSTKALWNHIDPNIGSNRSEKKWTNLGTFSILKHATKKSYDKLDQRDPLR